MNIVESLRNRRSYYAINKELPVSEDAVIEQIKTLTALVPDAFDMKSSRIVVVMKEQQDLLWDTIYDVFEGKVPREKIDSFKAGAGTILYFYDQEVVRAMQTQFHTYADSFPGYALQASAMLQFTIWTGLRELGIGASLQHYNPIIDETIKGMLQIPATYQLVAQMPFGGIVKEPEKKATEDIEQRVRLVG